MSQEKELKYNIKEVSELMGMAISTLRHWDNFFNLDLERDNSGVRQYTQKDIFILENIVELKKKGLSLTGIKEMLEEKGLIDPQKDKKVIVLEDNALAFKEFLTETIKEATKEGLDDISFKVNEIISENTKQKEENEKLLAELNELKEKFIEFNNKPWWKKIF